MNPGGGAGTAQDVSTCEPLLHDPRCTSGRPFQSEFRRLALGVQRCHPPSVTRVAPSEDTHNAFLPQGRRQQSGARQLASYTVGHHELRQGIAQSPLFGYK